MSERWYEIVEAHFAEMTKAVATKVREHYYTACILGAKNIKVHEFPYCKSPSFDGAIPQANFWETQHSKHIIINRDSSIDIFSVVVLLLKYKFCLCNIIIPALSPTWGQGTKNIIINNVFHWRIRYSFLFFSLCVLMGSASYFRTVFTVLLSTMVSVSHIYCCQ